MSKIERAEVLVTSPGRNFVTLRITTSDGVTGLGDATLNGRELAVAGYLREHVVPLLIGKDPARIEDMWQYLYRGAYWRRGPVTMTAIAAVDVALWDIKGKVAGLPVYQLLGGRSRDGVMVYGHASGADVPSLLDDVARFRELGYRAIRAQAAVHLDTAVPNFGIQEYMEHAPETMEVFRSGARFADGLLHPSESPGLGVEYDDEVAARFPYEPRYLPVARRLDGSMHDW